MTKAQARRSARTAWWGIALSLLVLWGCPDPPADDDDSADEGSPPQIIHLPVEDGQPQAEPVTVTCTVTDDTGVAQVTLFFRMTGDSTWDYTLLFSGAEPDEYVGHIDPGAVTAAGVDYYIEALDADDPTSSATSPRGAPASHHAFSVKTIGLPLPFVEDWEGGELDELGWSTHENATTSFPWVLADVYAHSGAYAAEHTGGDPGQGTLRDWLVSPALEFDGTTEVAISWSELGLDSPSQEAHLLYLSMGSPDPQQGDFELVADLDPPLLEADWASSELIDLTPFVTEGVGYVAFYYQGEYPSDHWYIDDVYVGEPIARFELGNVGVYPLDFAPGDEFDLTTTVTNISLVDSEMITASLTSSDDLLDLSEAVVELGEVAAQTTLTPTFEVSTDEEHQDNTFLDITLRLDDGEHSWNLPFQLLLGEVSRARVDYDAGATGQLHLSLGHGDLGAPAFEVSTEVTDAGQWATDITSQADFLPPDVGGTRWWLTVSNDGPEDASVSNFAIEWGDQVHTCEAAPVVVGPGAVETLYIPSRPVLETATVLTAPSPVEAGDTGVQLTIIVTNSGTVATAGAMAGTLESEHEHVSNVSTGSVSFSASAVEPGEHALNISPFTFDVSGAHTDGSALTFTLWLDDGLEVFEVPVAVPVPL